MPATTRGRPAKFRQPRQGRPIYTPDDPGRYVRCQYCGFPCDTKRDKLSKRSGKIITIAGPHGTYYGVDVFDACTMGKKPTDEIIVDTTLTQDDICSSEGYYATGVNDVYTTANKSDIPKLGFPMPWNDLYTIVCREQPYIPIPSWPYVPDIEIAFNCPACGAQYTRIK